MLSHGTVKAAFVRQAHTRSQCDASATESFDRERFTHVSSRAAPDPKRDAAGVSTMRRTVATIKLLILMHGFWRIRDREFEISACGVGSDLDKSRRNRACFS